MAPGDTNLLSLIAQTVDLKPVGREHRGLCPWHQEKTPSLYVNPERQVWYCHGCGAGGGLLAWLQRLHGVDAKGAHALLRQSGASVPVGVPRPRISDAERRRSQKAQERLDVIATELTHTLPLATRRSDMEGRAWDKVESLYHRRDNLRAWWAQNIPGPQDWPD